MRKVYFDNAATSPVHPKVVEKMLPFLKEEFGNPSSIHSFGRKTRVAIEEARETVAEFINAKPAEIYFTSGGTEANNFAVFGIAKTEYAESGRNKIITTKVEHHCVMDAFHELEKQGFTSIFSNVDEHTNTNIPDFKKSLTEKTSLVSVIHVNNETGSINDIKSICEIAKENGTYFHTDAVQSFGKISIDVKQLGIDSLAASGHKINGPKGTGILYVKTGTPISPMIFGGSQERNRRGGTENVAGIIGFAEAIKIKKESRQDDYSHIEKLRKHFINGIKSIDKNGFNINGDDKNFPYILSITFNSQYYKNDSESMLMYLDINGVAASNGSACTSGTLKPSYVILNSGKTVEDANGTIRFSFGVQNTFDEVDYVLEVIKKMTTKFKR